MVTNLKKSKKIRAFCYRMIALGALVTAICTAVMGREALIDFCSYGADVFSGSIYDFPEFREYMGELYHNAMLGYAGIGDDKGYPLTEGHADGYAREARQYFEAEVKALGDDVLYYIRKPWQIGEEGAVQYNEFSNEAYPIFSEYDGHLLLPENMILCCYWDGESGALQFFDKNSKSINAQAVVNQYYTAQYKPNKEAAGEIKLVLAVSEDCKAYKLDMMEYKAARYREIYVTLLISIGVWFVFGLLSLFTGKAGRKAKEEFGEWSGRILLELKLVLFALTVVAFCYFGLYVFGYGTLTRMRIYDSLWIYFPISCVLYLFYTDIKQNGGRIFLNSLPVKGVLQITEIVRRKPWYRRASVLYISMLFGGIVLVVGGFFLIAFGYLPYYLHRDLVICLAVCGIVMVLAGSWLLYSYAKQAKLLKDTAELVTKIAEVSNGRTGISLKLSKHSMLEDAAGDLNKLEDGIEKAVEEQNRSNKMRVELLTNVSHDLKTPLTSIINYADLLCEEELPGDAAEYAAALQGKAYRLKNMVQDVFDLSKATSGNLTVEKSVIDLVKLIKQTLADMDERIQESNLSFKLNVSAEPLLIEADGEKLYRVFQNLFVNALQYSLDYSRVHIQLSEEDGFAVARVKNTSRMELNFEPSEIVERFVRADSARTTEGSGLGLSIVQSFAEACGGQFTVETDADMFTACVKFPLSRNPIVAEPVEETDEIV